MSVLVIGIDPGKGNGAISAVDEEGEPVFCERCCGDPDEIFDCLSGIFSRNAQLGYTYKKSDIVLAGLEKVHSSPQMGVTSAFTFGENFGFWRGILKSWRCPYHLVRPSDWMSDVFSARGIPGQKPKSIRSRVAALQDHTGEAKGFKKNKQKLVKPSLPYCRSRYPQLTFKNNEVDEGRADSLCIAEWTWRRWKGLV